MLSRRQSEGPSGWSPRQRLGQGRTDSAAGVRFLGLLSPRATNWGLKATERCRRRLDAGNLRPRCHGGHTPTEARGEGPSCLLQLLGAAGHDTLCVQVRLSRPCLCCHTVSHGVTWCLCPNVPPKPVRPHRNLRRNHICKDPISKYGCIHRRQGLGLPHQPPGGHIATLARPHIARPFTILSG